MSIKLLALTGLAISSAFSAITSTHAQLKPAIVSSVSGSETVSFQLYLPLAHKAELELFLAEQQTPGSAKYHQWLTPDQVQTRFGPTAATVAAVQKQLGSYGLTSTLVFPQLLQVSGTAVAAAKALGSPLAHGMTAKGRPVVMATSPILLSGATANAGAQVTGLTGMVRLHSRAKRAATPQNRYSPTGGYWFDDLKQAYTFPTYKTYTGKGAKIGVLISSAIKPSDMALYFGYEGLTPPKITVEKVLGGAPFDPTSGDSFEAELDVQQSGGMAPNAEITVYDIPDLSDEAFIAGLVKIVEDNKVDVVNMSFGGPELSYTAAYNGGSDATGILKVEDELMAIGNAMGITFVASSGDLGALSIPAAACFEDNAPNPCGKMVASAEFPASSPHVTAVGGTNLVTVYDNSRPNDLNSAYAFEEAYADPVSGDFEYGTTATGAYWGSGGGNSVVFPKPFYQLLVVTGDPFGRTVPDISLHMGGCPDVTPFAINCSPDDSYDLEVFAGDLAGVIGTSASAPDFAGLTALNIEKLGGRTGNENLYIYTLSALQKAGIVKDVFHWGIPGFNGLYNSGNQGYNRVLGNGTVFAKDFLLAPNVPSAGIPRTPSNP